MSLALTLPAGLPLAGAGRTARRLWALGAALALALVWHSGLLPAGARLAYAWLWLELLLALLVAVPSALGVLLWAGVLGALNAANHAKLAMLQFPVTHQDLAIAAANPRGMFDALGVPRGQQALIVASLVAVLGLLLWRRARRRPGVPWPVRCAEAMPALVLAACAVFVFARFYTASGEYFAAHRDAFFRSQQAWSTRELVHAVDKLSGLGFLAFSHGATHASTLQLKRLARGSSAAEMQAVAATARDYLSGVRLPAAAGSLQPNIVFVLAESTFDPNAAFRLTQPVRNTLFGPAPHETAGLLTVTPVGGGTWKTEFETITGIDSRQFGFLGEYTHVSLSPYVRASFVSYLNRHGFDTGAYYPVDGSFYSARQAYRNYGFSHFEDAQDLGLETDWTRFSDEAMARVVAARLPASAARPFFRYVVLLENHSPHPCREGNAAPAALAGEADADKQCRLAEYLRRAASTERGFRALVARLRGIERETGRPFLAVVFGDHQPATFTHPEFDRNRTGVSKFRTFYRLVGSDGLELPAVPEPFHATLLPTIASAVVARDANDMFLPASLYAHETCMRQARQACGPAGVLAKAYGGMLTF